MPSEEPERSTHMRGGHTYLIAETDEPDWQRISRSDAPENWYDFCFDEPLNSAMDALDELIAWSLQDDKCPCCGACLPFSLCIDAPGRQSRRSQS